MRRIQRGPADRPRLPNVLSADTTASRYSLGATIVLSSDLDGPELFP